MLRSDTLCSYSTIKSISVVYMVTVSSHFQPYILSNSTVLHSVTVWSHIILRQIQHCNFIYEKVMEFWSTSPYVQTPLAKRDRWGSNVKMVQTPLGKRDRRDSNVKMVQTPLGKCD